MATDWIVYYMTRPLGLLAITFAFVLPFLIWRAVLGNVFTQIGYKPLVAGYMFSHIGLLAMNFSASYFEFSSRVTTGILTESDRWKHVPGWSIYLTLLSLIFVLPMLGLIAAPISAFLIRRGAFSLKAIFNTLVIAWLGLSVSMWYFPSNEWHRTHRLEALFNFFSTIGIGFLCVAIPFCLGIYKTKKH